MGFVWQKDQISQLGRQIAQREARLHKLEDDTDKLKKQLGTMRSPPFLERRIQDLRLGLVRTQPAQVLRLPEPAPELARPECEQYATPRQARVEPRG